VSIEPPKHSTKEAGHRCKSAKTPGGSSGSPAGDYLFAFDVATWGWIHLIWGIFLALTAAALLSGATWARLVGIILAGFAALEAFLFIPYQPFWSTIVIALAVLVIWALTTSSTRDLDDVRP
jgi:hypothetical protein